MSTPINDGGSAFPVIVDIKPFGIANFEGRTGASLRDWFAKDAPAIPAWFDHLPDRTEEQMVKRPIPSSPSFMRREQVVVFHESDLQWLTRWRFTYADAMIAQRKLSS